MMKKRYGVLSLLLAFVLLLGACGSATEPQKSEEPKASEEQGEASGSEMTGDKKPIVALLCDPAGTQVFVLDTIRGLEDAAKKYGFEARIVECEDSAAYEDQARALLQEGVSFILGGAWQAGEAISTVAKEFPDAATYAIIDTEVAQENVKSIYYHEQEGAYLIGQIAALVTQPDEKIFGSVHVNEGPGSWKWRWGYMEGVKSIKPDATFIFNYVGGYSEPAKAKEFALQQYEQGARFINAAAAGGDSGVFEAAKEKGFYTSGQDVDLTSPDNPYVLTCQLKDSHQTVLNVMDEYFGGKEWTSDNETLGLKEGGVGAVHITHESKNPPQAPLTQEIIDQVKETAEKIKSGELNLRNMPTEEEFNAANK